MENEYCLGEGKCRFSQGCGKENLLTRAVNQDGSNSYECAALKEENRANCSHLNNLNRVYRILHRLKN